MGATEDEFDGFENAELMHARGLATPVAEQICACYLERGTWRRAPQAWTMLAERTRQRPDATRDALGWFAAWVEAVSHETVEQAHDEVLRTTIGWGLLDASADVQARLRVAEELVRWLCTKAGPGAAGSCAHLLWYVYSDTRKREWIRPHDMPEPGEAEIEAAQLLADVFTPLARHLVEVGIAELRSNSHDGLMGDIVETLARCGPPELLVAAFEIMLAAGHERRFWTSERGSHRLWRLTEAALAAGLPPNRCWDIVTGTKLDIDEIVWAPLLHDGSPRCAAALRHGLATGGIPAKVSRPGWVILVLTAEPPDSSGALTQSASLILTEILTLEILSRSRWGPLPRWPDLPIDADRIGRWVVFAATDVLRHAGPARAQEGRRFVADKLTRLVQWSSNLDAIEPKQQLASGLLAWLEAADIKSRELVLATKILRDNPEPTIAAAAALECLAQTPVTAGAAAAHEEFLAQLSVDFERFLLLPWNEPVFGIDVRALFAGVTSVVFQDDASEQVSMRGSTMTLSPNYYRDIHRRRGPSEEARALCMLYFVHELLHIPQGIGEFQTVQQLRAVGAELTLMHLDLTADHAAILMVNRAVPRWLIVWLERLVLGSLESFPASSFHTQAARYRKAVRLVSARVDLLAREQQRVGQNAWGYLFVDFAPAGGGLFILAYGPPLRVLAQVEISADEARLLNDAATPSTGGVQHFGKIDGILERALAAWRPST
jgi:hypothetical protein